MVFDRAQGPEICSILHRPLSLLLLEHAGAGRIDRLLGHILASTE